MSVLHHFFTLASSMLNFILKKKKESYFLKLVEFNSRVFHIMNSECLLEDCSYSYSATENTVFTFVTGLTMCDLQVT